MRTAGRVADRVLLWAVPDSDLERTAALVAGGPADGRADGRAELVWAPLVDHGPGVAAHLDVLACYGVMNAAPLVRRRWGLSEAVVAEVRAALVAGDVAAARAKVPERVVDDLVRRDTDPTRPAWPRGPGRSASPPWPCPPSPSSRWPSASAWARAVEAGLA